MKIQLHKQVFKKFPNLKIVFLIIKDMNNLQKLEESQHLLEDISELNRQRMHPDKIKDHRLIKPWDVVREEFGDKAKHYHTSVEKLLKDVLSRKSVVAKDTVSNLVKSVALKHIVPLAMDDLDKVEGDIFFDLAKGTEKKSILTKFEKDDLYYRDNKGILGGKLDYWKSSRTMLKGSSTSALVHMEILLPLDAKKQQEIINELKMLLESFTGGKVKVLLLSKSKKESKI